MFIVKLTWTFFLFLQLIARTLKVKNVRFKSKIYLILPWKSERSIFLLPRDVENFCHWASTKPNTWVLTLKKQEKKRCMYIYCTSTQSPHTCSPSSKSPGKKKQSSCSLKTFLNISLNQYTQYFDLNRDGNKWKIC